MTDPRVRKLAHLLINYSLSLKPKDEFVLFSSPLAHELNLAVYEEAIQLGAYVTTNISMPGADEVFYKFANDDQLDYVSPVQKMMAERFNAFLRIGAFHNTRELSGVDPEKQGRAHKAFAPISKTAMERVGRGELKGCYTVFPTDASAQEADMSLREYEDFVYGAGMLDLDDPAAAWREEYDRQMKLISWMAGKDQVVLKGRDIDLRMSIGGRKFREAAGHENFPDGEIYTAPVESSTTGWVRFEYPAIYSGREVTGIELWFEDGRVVKEIAAKGQEFLTALLNSDAGARILGELGIGTNYSIQRFTKNMLFDEKIGGTIHLAVGAGYPETGSQNHSGLHWDMLCNMAESEITVDGELFYKDGKTVI